MFQAHTGPLTPSSPVVGFKLACRDHGRFKTVNQKVEMYLIVPRQFGDLEPRQVRVIRVFPVLPAEARPQLRQVLPRNIVSSQGAFAAVKVGDGNEP